MRIRTQYTLVTAALVAGVVGGVAVTLTRAQRRILEAESTERLTTLVEGVTRIAGEAYGGRDELMLVSYLMFLQREHPELAMATVTRRGHTTRIMPDTKITADERDLTLLARTVSDRRLPVTYTVTTQPTPTAPSSGAVKASPDGLTLEVKGNATVRVEEPQRELAVVRLGFVTSRLQSEIDRALRPLLERTLLLAALFMSLGLLAATYLSRLLTGPLTSLAEAAVLVERGDFNVSLEPRGADEVGALTRQFNRMTAGLKELLQFREDILHALTHEMNTPLSGLKGYLELMQDDKLPLGPARAEALGVMMAAVTRMEDSLGSALRMFKSQRLAADPSRQAFVWINEVFEDVLTLFSPVAKAKAIALHPIPTHMLGWVYADAEFVKQVASNLVSNALKYTPDGGEVRVGLRSSEDEVTFWVSDTGPGIAPQDIPRVFEKFVRVGEEKRVPGTGLGLAIARQAVEAMGGRIWVESRLGEGSTFYVSLPTTAVNE